MTQCVGAHAHTNVPICTCWCKGFGDDNQLIPGVFQVAASALGGGLSIARALACILQESRLDDNGHAEKLKIMRTHVRAIIDNLDDSPKTAERLTAILGDD